MVFGIGNRFANRHTGSVEKYTQGEKSSISIQPTQIGSRVVPRIQVSFRRQSGANVADRCRAGDAKSGAFAMPENPVTNAASGKRTLLRKTHFYQRQQPHRE